MDGYILKGVNDEYLLVIKSDNIETILHLIDKISTSTKDEIKDLERNFEYYNCGNIQYTITLHKKYIGGKKLNVKAKLKKKNKLL